MTGSSKPIVIFGTGDIGELAHFYFTHDSSRQIAGFCADGAFIESPEHLGAPLVAFEEVEQTFPPDRYDMFVALSYRKVNQVRAQKYDEAKQRGYALASYVCSRSVIWPNLQIGDNCFILENQTIQPFVKIGNNVTLWSGNHLGHHSVIGDHCFITSEVVISGHVTVESHCFLGVNATIRDGITIGREGVIGAGAVILKNTEPKAVHMARPTGRFLSDSSRSPYFVNTRYGR